MKKRLIKYKIYYDRARMYVNMLQSLMIVTMFLEITGLHIRPAWYIPLFIIFILAAMFVGYLDTKLGFRSEEMRNNTNHNPIQKEMLDSIRQIKEELGCAPNSPLD